MLLVCTTNRRKREEFKELLKEFEPVRVKDKAVELQASLEAVAMHAASLLYAKYRKPLIVEDAGLFIRALRGFPGPYSSYVMKTIGYRGILKLMHGVVDRYAEFRSVIAFAYDKGIKLFKGVVGGVIAFEPRGTSGFGFDPIFIPEGKDKTFAEMSMEEKNAISHRGRAVRELIEWLRDHF